MSELRKYIPPEAQEDVAPTRTFAYFHGSVESDEHPQSNEDTFLILDDYNVVSIFDGMGGEFGGAEASQAAKAAVEQFITQKAQKPATLKQAMEMVADGISAANVAVIAEGKAHKDMGRMGTTGIVSYMYPLANGEVDVVTAYIGDSRQYIHRRNGELEQVTLDQNYTRLFFPSDTDFYALQEKFSNLTDPNQLDEGEQLCWNHRAKISQKIGDPRSKPEVVVARVRPGDRVIYVTDGVTDNLTDEEMQTVLNDNEGGYDAIEVLLKESILRSRDETHHRSKPDDMTVVIVEPNPLPEDGTLQIGQIVDVQRSDQKIEGGWEIIAFSEDGHPVVKGYSEDGRPLVKEVPYNLLLSLNS